MHYSTKPSRFYNLTLLLLLGLFVLTSSCTPNKGKQLVVNQAAIIPAPQQLEKGIGYFTLSKTSTLFAIPEFKTAANFLKVYLEKGAGIDIVSSNKAAASIVMVKDTLLQKEGYTLRISKQQITIKASDGAGAFYAVQSLRQILPPVLELPNPSLIDTISIACMEIKDAPMFSYRGMHLDVSRHYFPKEFIKQYIAWLAALKINTFHWHLTDDQGWRIEIKQYPDLTRKGAYRKETLIGHYNDTPQRFDGKPYGGFYTQQEVKEIVAFAKDHHVTIIPEIELPGHAQAAISAYPSLGCTSQQVPVATKWGVFENIYCPKPETFTFLKNTLDEVMELFPGQYIHIGGDEAPKTKWKKCTHCQQLIKEQKLEDAHGLQSYFITEIEKHINAKGKKIIGWDEILEGGLAPNATVMSWRGTQGAIDAARQGHDVILTPTSHTYFDYYQATYEQEPTAIGGYLPLKKVFGFNPIPQVLQNTDAASHVLGAQGNVWTEYMATKEQVEYMVFPRIVAMSEVVWSGAAKNIEEDYTNFLSRLEQYLERLDVKNINYANHLYDLEGGVIKKQGAVSYALTTPTKGKEIKYRLNTAQEQIYTSPLSISQDAIITGQVYKEGKKVGRTFTDTIHYHKAINASVSLNVAPHSAYGAGGSSALINGVSGSNTRYGDKEWLGFWGDDLKITITFAKPTKISKISTRFYNANGQWVYAPKAIEVQTDFGTLPVIKLPATDQTILDVNLKASGTTSFIKISVPSFGSIPDGLQGAGNKAWTFIDEIVVE